MRNYRKLKETLHEGEVQVRSGIDNINVMAKDAERVSTVARDAHIIISDIDKQFAAATKLNGTDITFLFLAVALQVARQYLLSNDKFKLTADQGDQLIKDPLKKVVPKDWQDILLGSVPYDAVERTDGFKELGESTGISGATHRYRTLGHDPVLGWIMGPVNILSDSLTKSNFIETYSVENMKIAGLFPGSTAGAIRTTVASVQETPILLPAAVAKQGIHFGADYFTKQGLPIPFLGSINNDASKFLTYSGINTFTIARSAGLAIVINELVGCIHKLFFDPGRDGSPQLYEVRTRKILSYSNLIASVSNIIVVAVTKDVQKLDVGGILVTLYRIVTDYKFIQQVKQEFLEKEFYNIVMGDEYNF